MDLQQLQEALFGKLKELGISTETIEHPAAPTVDEHTAHLASFGADAGQAKNLCLKDKKGNIYLITTLKDTKTDMKEISERLGVPKSAPLRMAAADKMQEALGVQPGSVTPFGIMSTGATNVRLLLDAKFKGCKTLLFHPFINTKTTAITPADFDKWLLAIGRTPEYVDFASDSSLTKAPEGNGPAAAASPTPKAPKPEKAPKEKKDKPSQQPKKQGEVESPTTPPKSQVPASVSTGPAKVLVEKADRELTSDDWASGKFGRAAGELDVKPWSQTIFAMPPGFEDAPDWLNDAEGRAAGKFTEVSWASSIFQKPAGWA